MLLLVFQSCEGQSEEDPVVKNELLIGGPFENRDLFFDGMPEEINSVDTSDSWANAKQRLLITGTIFGSDGRTPVSGVILYYYHTDENGYYSGESIHGDLRGWVKSDVNGQYSIYTSRPAAYPDSDEPAHIHPTILESVADYPYYLDAFVFDDDKLLTTAKRNAMENRGGSGVLRLIKSDSYDIAEHDIFLGLNIPNYPVEDNANRNSGKKIGEDLTSFTPYHVWGADKGSTACPICKYGKHQGILYFTGENADLVEIEDWLVFFEEESIRRGGLLKVYMMINDERIAPMDLEQMGKKLNIQHVALTIGNEKEMAKNGINLEVDNTVMIYRRSNIVDKYIDLKPIMENQELLSRRLEETEGAFLGRK